MNPTWQSGWPTNHQDTTNSLQDSGWHRYSESVPTIPTTIEDPTAIQQVSHAEQNPWLLAEYQPPHPIARHVRYVEPGTRLPIDTNSPPPLPDRSLTRGEPPHEANYQQPYLDSEATRHLELSYQQKSPEATEPRPSFSAQMMEDFPDLERSLIASVLTDAPTIASAIGTLQRIREENHNLQAAKCKLRTSEREMRQENEGLRMQLETSHAAVQDLLGREYPRLDTRVVAVTLRDSGYDVAFTRRVLGCLLDF
ncbi:MAG: hypothetical protein Q9195_005688 [Heterodermia aff. obscurata]